MAIKKRLLIHSATLKGNVVRDAWGNVTGSDDIELTHIRYDPTSKLVQTPTNQEVQLKAVIFFDITNSRPVGTTFKQDQPIIFNGVEHRIVNIQDVYDGKKLHHWELEVI